MLSPAGVNYQRLKKFCFAKGARLFGVADISDVKKKFGLSRDVVQRVDRAVSLGIGLSPLCLAGIEDAPTKLYYHHYRTANMFLDQAAFAVAHWIQERGFLALAIPASQIIDWQNQRAHLSHKKIGVLAGVGWIGRNNLLVSKKFGAQFRLVTILTNMPLKADRSQQADCGPCLACVSACPVNAIGERSEDFKHLVCFGKLKDFQKRNIVGQFICGVCVKACRGKRG